MSKSLAVDLFCGLGGWAEGFIAEGYDVIGFDIERRPYPGQLVLQDALTIHGSQFRDVAAIVASPPCQAYSYMAMPWKRGKAIAAEIRADESGARLRELNALFDACFRIQREASEAAGRYIPMVVENVSGAQRWVGRAAWHFGSFYLWGDVPALMPFAYGRKVATNFHVYEKTGLPSPSFHGAPHEASVRRALEGLKGGGDWVSSGENCSQQRRASSGSSARAQASAEIAKIPFALAQHIAVTFKPCVTNGAQ